MNCSKKSVFLQLLSGLLVISALVSSGCSPNSGLSAPGIVGGLIGVGSGAAAAAIIGEKEPGITNEGALMIGGAAGALGMTAGALMHESQVEAEKQQYYKRVPYPVNPQQDEVDRLRQHIDDSSSWGRREIRPYEDRYQTQDDPAAFQGAQ